MQQKKEIGQKPKTLISSKKRKTKESYKLFHCYWYADEKKKEEKELFDIF